MARTRINRSLSLALGAAILLSSGVGQTAKKQQPDEYVVTEAELQLELMSYADRYAAVAAQVIDDVERLGPPPETRRVMLGDLVYSAAAAFTIAADPDPQVALLDMVVMTTLGRIVYEDYWRPRLGEPADVADAAFSKLEGDIWAVAAPILSDDQQRELRERIVAFHTDNPELSTFSHLRFADFPSKRASSTLKKKKSGGIFGSVKNISDQVEQTRIMAERAMYLSTRLPLLTGGFADIWVSRLSINPAVEELRQDLHNIALVSDRLATVAEQLPDQLTTERNDTIEQLAREATTLRYEAIEHLNHLVLSTDGLLNSPGADRLVPGLIEAINEAGQTSEDLVDHSFIRAALLILFALIGYVIARLCYRWLAMRMFGSAT